MAASRGGEGCCCAWSGEAAASTGATSDLLHEYNRRTHHARCPSPLSPSNPASLPSDTTREQTNRPVDDQTANAGTRGSNPACSARRRTSSASASGSRIRATPLSPLPTRRARTRPLTRSSSMPRSSSPPRKSQPLRILALPVEGGSLVLTNPKQLPPWLPDG